MSIQVKLSDIIGGMELPLDEMSSYLNLENGEIVTLMHEEFQAAEEEDHSSKELYGLEEEGIEIAREILADFNNVKYIALPSKFEIHEWSIMEQFSLSIEDEEISESLYNAIHGRGAFRFFKDSIHRFGIADQWYKYRDAALKRIAIDWCEANSTEYYQG